MKNDSEQEQQYNYNSLFVTQYNSSGHKQKKSKKEIAIKIILIFDYR